ncbi:unnamed protein product [Protopolystoma xenopodis]|uniref:Uncharacterized protein n=1 Tax=Protopolystoma xenopodis TaxID=117903 RepID=A0A3S5ACL8_9PLAT|nr:unnamed protein product [Protopolystoma xenopodis]
MEDCVNLSIVLKRNGCSTTGFRRRLLLRALSYEMKVSPTKPGLYAAQSRFESLGGADETSSGGVKPAFHSSLDTF